jgi:hypothetical protein
MTAFYFHKHGPRYVVFGDVGYLDLGPNATWRQYVVERVKGRKVWRRMRSSDAP